MKVDNFSNAAAAVNSPATPGGTTAVSAAAAMANPMSAQDDLVVGGTGGTPTRLGKGSDGDVLTVDPTTHHLVWASSSGVADIVDIPTAETDTSLLLAPDGAGGVEWVTPSGSEAVYPASVPGLSQWFAADKITGLSDGDAVTLWLNAAPLMEGFDLNAAGSPTYKTGILNSLPIVRFGGSDAFKMYTLADVQPGWTFFIVFKLSSITPAYSGIYGYGGPIDGGGYFIKSNGKSAEYPTGSTAYDGTGSATFDTTNWNYVCSVHGPTTTYSTRRNGSADATGISFSWSTSYPLAYIGTQAVAGRAFSGDIAEILIYTRPLTSSQITSVESYISTKYAL